MSTFIFAYLCSFALSITIIFQLMINRIKMMKVCDDHYNYLKYDCMMSNITETKYGNQIGIISTIFVIPVIFFLMFYIMDVLRLKTYYKNYIIDKNKLSIINFDINKNIIKPTINFIDIDKLCDKNTTLIKIPI